MSTNPLSRRGYCSEHSSRRPCVECLYAAIAALKFAGRMQGRMLVETTKMLRALSPRRPSKATANVEASNGKA